jgi:hypothetical protein
VVLGATFDSLSFALDPTVPCPSSADALWDLFSLAVEEAASGPKFGFTPRPGLPDRMDSDGSGRQARCRQRDWEVPAVLVLAALPLAPSLTAPTAAMPLSSSSLPAGLHRALATTPARRRDGPEPPGY